jgi:hypothetical protein
MFFSSCQKHHIHVTSIKIDKSSLASSFSGAIDPRQEVSAKGQQLYIEWNLPKKYDKMPISLQLDIIYNDQTHETIVYDVIASEKRLSFFLLGEKYRETKGVMSYKASIITQKGDIVQEWKKNSWFNLIQLD